jgi:RNA polymerase sigma-70 factor (sigma-E family)
MTPTGREDGFEDFVRIFRSKLRIGAFAICGEWHAAEDMVQETLLILHRRWGDVDPGARVAYARTVMMRLADQRHRRAAARLEFLASELPEPGASAGKEFADQVAVRLMLGDALLNLPRRQRKAVYLRYWAGLSVADIAQSLGVPAGTVRSDLSRGVSRLKASLGQAGGDSWG